MSDLTYLDQHLADLPDVVDVSLLAKKADWITQTIYQRNAKIKRTGDVTLLPVALVVPGSSDLKFTKQAVIDWFKSVAGRENVPQKRRGRPLGASSRRGIGRTAMEGAEK